MRKVWPAAVMVAISVFGAVGSARAWEPAPGLPGHQTTVTRIVDVGNWAGISLVALAESPAAACAAIAQNPYPPAGVFSDAWVAMLAGDGSGSAHMLAVALTARTQNLLVRVTIGQGNGICRVMGLQTCADAAACALPAAP